MSPRQTFWGWISAVLSAAFLTIGLTSAPTSGVVLGAPQLLNPQRPGNQLPDTEPVAADVAHKATDLLPKDPLIYVGIDGMQAHRAEYEKTAAYQAFVASGFQPVVEKMFQEAFGTVQSQIKAQMEAQLSDNDLQETQKAYKQLEDLGKTLEANGFHLAVALPTAEGPSLPWAIAVLPGQARFEPQIANLVQKAVANEEAFELLDWDRDGQKNRSLRNSQFPPAELSWWVDGNSLIVVGGVNATEQAMAVAEGTVPNITESRLWKAYHAKALPNGLASAGRVTHSLGWFDAAQAAKATGPLAIPTRDQGRKVTVAQVLEAAGLNGLKSIVAQSGFDGPANWSEVRVETVPNPEGLLAMGGTKTMTLADLPPLPAAASGHFGGNGRFGAGGHESGECGPGGCGPGTATSGRPVPAGIGFTARAAGIRSHGGPARAIRRHCHAVLRRRSGFAGVRRDIRHCRRRCPHAPPVPSSNCSNASNVLFRPTLLRFAGCKNRVRISCRWK